MHRLRRSAIAALVAAAAVPTGVALSDAAASSAAGAPGVVARAAAPPHHYRGHQAEKQFAAMLKHCGVKIDKVHGTDYDNVVSYPDRPGKTVRKNGVSIYDEVVGGQPRVTFTLPNSWKLCGLSIYYSNNEFAYPTPDRIKKGKTHYSVVYTTVASDKYVSQVGVNFHKPH